MSMLSVVIPAYNEEQGIAKIIGRVLAMRNDLISIGLSRMELLIVDDGSHDKTLEIANGIARDDVDLRVIAHPKNRGYGAALKTGFAQARGDLLGFMDADGTYPPECLPELCRIAMNGSDLVIGSRMAGADSEMPVTRRVGNFFFANLLSLVGGQRVTDSASGMRIFKREILDRLYPLPDGLNFTPVMSTRAMHEGIKVSEIAIPYSERVGRSKLSVIRDGSRFLKSILWTALSYNPVRILGMTGLGGVGLALLIGLGLILTRLSGVTQIGPWGVVALFAGLTSAVAGVSLFALGATFNYLVSLFYNRPIRQGLFGHPLFKEPLDRQFGWIGLATLAVGLAVSITSLGLGVNGWEISRLWLYLLGGAMLVLIGSQLFIYWILMRVLEELSHRDLQAQKDLNTSLSEA
jgi:glycosyltransferase involved in cell wall biosynthesis